MTVSAISDPNISLLIHRIPFNWKTIEVANLIRILARVSWALSCIGTAYWFLFSAQYCTVCW